MDSSGVAKILEENHYYPFGLQMQGDWLQNKGRENKYLYNGKELDTDFGLNVYFYGARVYDAAVGRFTGVDPLAADFAAWSPYSYSFNNPIRFTDPTGMAPEDIIITYRADKNSSSISVRYGEDGKLYNTSDGQEYSGDNEFILGVKNTLDNLQQLDDRVNSVVDDLVTGSEKHSINNFDFLMDGTEYQRDESYNVRSRESDNPKGSLTKFVPDMDKAGANDETLTNEEILGHELKHAYNRKHGLTGKGYTPNRVPNEEIDGINFQNVIREKQGKGPRTKFARGRKDITPYLTPTSQYNNLKKK